MTLDDDHVGEDVVARAFGMSIRDLRAMRSKLPDDGVVKNARRVLFSPGAIEALKKLTGVDPDIPQPDPEKTATDTNGAAPEPIMMHVERLCPNPTWVKARNTNGELIDVKVLNNHNMRRGQWIRVRHDGTRFVIVRERAT